MNDRKYNRILLFSNGLFALFLWLCYVVLSFVLLGDILLSTHGLLIVFNSFLFTICALTIAFVIGTIVSNKNAINGIVNVVALGSSFLCGAFVPMEWLPKFVLDIAHLLPSYWYIKTNELVKTIEKINIDTIRPILQNMGMLIVFIILMILITNFISHKKNRRN